MSHSEALSRPREGHPTPAALRSRLRGFQRALSLPGADLPSRGWVEAFDSREWTLDELLGSFDDEFTEECRQAQHAYEAARAPRFFDGPLAPRDPFPPRETYIWHESDRPVIKALRVFCQDMPREYFPPPEPFICEHCGLETPGPRYCECQK